MGSSTLRGSSPRSQQGGERDTRTGTTTAATTTMTTTTEGEEEDLHWSEDQPLTTLRTEEAAMARGESARRNIGGGARNQRSSRTSTRNTRRKSTTTTPTTPRTHNTTPTIVTTRPTPPTTPTSVSHTEARMEVVPMGGARMDMEKDNALQFGVPMPAEAGF